MTRIGFLGAYSIDNTGDQLLGYATREAIRARVPRAEHVLLAPAFRGDIWRHAWDRDRGVDVEVRKIPADGSVGWAKGLDALVIGGGELVRLEPDFRPFLLGEASDWAALTPAVPAAWNAVGAENAPPYLSDQRAKYRAIQRCCETLRVVSVRNEATARFVRRCGFEGALSLVPDPTVLLAPPPAAARGDAILEDAGVDTSKLVIGLSVGTSLKDPRAATFYKDLFAALAGRSGTELVLFPFGNVYGDAELQRAAARLLPGCKLVTAKLGALDRWRLIGALDLYVATRYHAMLAAFVQDVPFVVMDEYLSDVEGTSKIREFIAAHELGAFYLCPFLSTRPREKLANATALAFDDDFTFAPRVERQRAAMNAHYDAMVRSLGLV